MIMSNSLYLIAEESQFDEIIKKHAKVYCLFSAAWCPPCTSLKAKFSIAAVKDIPIYIFDIDNCQTLANRLRIRGIPHSMLYVNGEWYKMHSGDFQTPQKLSEWILSPNT